MAVTVQLEYKDPDTGENTLSGIGSYVCFGFLAWGDPRICDILSIPMKARDSVHKLHYYPKLSPYSYKSDATYLRVLQEVGVRKVLEFAHPHDLDLHSLKRVSVDLSKHSGQAAVGALELIRNLEYHSNFCAMVVWLYEQGVSAEVSLFIPRYFNEAHVDGHAISWDSPYADTSYGGHNALYKGAHKIFSDEVLANPAKFPPWTEGMDYNGVYRYYSADRDVYEPQKDGIPFSRETMLSSKIIRGGAIYCGTDYASTDRQLLESIYTYGVPSYDVLLKQARHYDETGEFL